MPINLLRRREKKKIGPWRNGERGLGKRELLGRGDKNKYIYRNWSLSQSLFDKKINRHGQNKNRIAENCKTKKEREHFRGILTT